MKHGLILSSALLVALLAAPLAAWADANPDFDDDAKPILKMQPGLLHYVQSRFDVKDRGTAKYPGDDDRRPQPPFIFRARPMGSNGPFNLRLLIQPGQPGHILGVVDITRVHMGNPNGPAVASQPPPQEGQPYQPQRDEPFQPGPDQAQAQPPQPGPDQSQAGPPPDQGQPYESQPGSAPAPVQVPELSSGPVDQQPIGGPNQTPGPVTQPAPKQSAPAAPTADTPSGPIMAPSSQGASNSGQPSLAPPPDPAPAAQ
jgi:hypothetical protein